MLASRVGKSQTQAAGFNVMCGASESRVSITFFAPNGGLATISTDNPPTQGTGILLLQNSPPVHLNIHDHGDCVQMEWYVNYSTGGFPVAFIESLATCEPDQLKHFGKTLKQRNQMFDRMMAG